MSNAQIPYRTPHFAGIFRQPEPTTEAETVDRAFRLSAHTATRSPRGDAGAGWTTMLDSLSDLSGDDQATFAMASPADLFKQSAERLNALGADPEAKEVADAILPALVGLGRCHHDAGADDEDDDERTPADRRRKYAKIERGGDLEQEEMQRRCIVEGHSGRVVSHIRTR